MAANNLNKLIKQLDILLKTDKIERRVFSSALADTDQRIFKSGLDANNSPIGTYSKGYMKVRQKNNWPTSTKVILQAEGQMRQDWSLIVENNSYGLGFKNSSGNMKEPGNLEKSILVEETYDKEIFKHTNEEIDKINQLFQEEVRKVLK